MVSLSRGVVLVASGSLVAAGMFALAAPASAQTPVPAGWSGQFTLPGGHVWPTPRTIDTDRVIGFPQHVPVPPVFALAGRGAARNQRVAPTVTTNPVSQTVTVGATVTFTAAASGTPAPKIHWMISTNGGASFRRIRGAKSSSYTFTATASQNGDEFEAEFTNSAGSATSTAATLTVTTAAAVAPTVTTNPVSQSVTAGTSVTFTAAASGSPAPSVQWMVSTNGGGSFTAIGGATSASYTFTATASESGDEFEAVFTNSAGTATTTPATLTVTPATTTIKSTNWSGYVDTDTTYTAVTGSWTVPTVTCTRTATYSAQWVGIDGYSSDTVEQDGTEADCLNGVASYDAWYEMYGDNTVNNGNEVELSPDTNPVAPGDVMTGTVSVTGTSWTLAIADTTAGWHYTTTIVFAGGAQSSAEWIVERPDVCTSFSCSTATLSDFGTVTFTGAKSTTSAGTAPIDANDYTIMDMTDNSGNVIATPGALNGAGTGFTDTWHASPSGGGGWSWFGSLF